MFEVAKEQFPGAVSLLQLRAVINTVRLFGIFSPIKVVTLN